MIKFDLEFEKELGYILNLKKGLGKVFNIWPMKRIV
jgi:hypothetical protein